MCELKMMFLHCFGVMTILLAAVEQVIANDHSASESCYVEQCNVDEFCCNGFCCSYFKRDWFAWIVIFLLVFVTVGTCFCFPRLSSWKHDSIQPVEYQIFTAAPSNVPCTRQHKQQPQQYQTYSYEQLVQQSLPERSYPAPSAPIEIP